MALSVELLTWCFEYESMNIMRAFRTDWDNIDSQPTGLSLIDSIR